MSQSFVGLKPGPWNVRAWSCGRPLQVGQFPETGTKTSSLSSSPLQQQGQGAFVGADHCGQKLCAAGSALCAHFADGELRIVRKLVQNHGALKDEQVSSSR